MQVAVIIIVLGIVACGVALMVHNWRSISLPFYTPPPVPVRCGVPEWKNPPPPPDYRHDAVPYYLHPVLREQTDTGPFPKNMTGILCNGQPIVSIRRTDVDLSAGEIVAVSYHTDGSPKVCFRLKRLNHEARKS